MLHYEDGVLNVLSSFGSPPNIFGALDQGQKSFILVSSDLCLLSLTLMYTWLLVASLINTQPTRLLTFGRHLLSISYNIFSGAPWHVHGKFGIFFNNQFPIDAFSEYQNGMKTYARHWS